MSSRKRAQLQQDVEVEVRRFIAGAILFNLKAAEDVGINATDMQCLHVLALEGSATPTQLAGWSRLTTGGITVMLDRLERAGYLKREPNPNDRRSIIIRPVLSAFSKFESIYRSKAKALANSLDSFNDIELRVILDFFKRTNQAGRD